MSLVEDAAQIAELQAMQNGGLDSEPLQMMLRPTPSLPRRKKTAVAAKKKERSELRGELKKRKSSADEQLSVTRVRDSARVMRVARSPCELELRQSALQSSTRDVR